MRLNTMSFHWMKSEKSKGKITPICPITPDLRDLSDLVIRPLPYQSSSKKYSINLVSAAGWPGASRQSPGLGQERAAGGCRGSPGGAARAYQGNLNKDCSIKYVLPWALFYSDAACWECFGRSSRVPAGVRCCCRQLHCCCGNYLSFAGC